VLVVLATFVVAMAIAVVADVVVGGTPAPVAFTNKIAPGYVLDRSASGALTMSNAARATIATADELGPQLVAAHFTGGQSRVWTNGDQFAEIEIFNFRSAAGATSVMQYSLDLAVHLAGGGSDAKSAVLTKVPGVPGATAFYAAGNQTAGGPPLFVWGSWFTVGQHAYLIETGSPQPLTAAFMRALTQAEFRLVT
jgi:hypothetical protein